MERATNSSLILYTTEDGLTKIEATFDRDTVWLSIDQMADLFQRNKSTISRHIGNVYKEGELDRTATVAKFATVQMEGERQVEQMCIRDRMGYGKQYKISRRISRLKNFLKK